MPVYEYLCPTGHRFDAWKFMSERHQPERCAKCGAMAPYVISAPRVFADFEGYVSPATGNWIEGRRAREEDLKRSGCRPYEEGEAKDAARKAAEAERAADKAVDEAVDRTLAEMKNA